MTDEPLPESGEGVAPPWTANWQMPVLLLGVGLLALGVYLAMPRPQRQNYEGSLKSVAQYLEAGELDKAEQKLRTDAPFMEKAPPSIRARYWQLWGDQYFLTVQKNGWDSEENLEGMLKFYQQARELGLKPDAEHLMRWSWALVKLKRDDQAMALLEVLEGPDLARRYPIVRQIIERRAGRGGMTPDELAPWLTRYGQELEYEPDPAKKRAAKLWGTLQQAQLWLASAEPEKALDFLQVRLLRFQDEGGDKDLAPLRLQMAKAYQAAGRYDDAERWYRLAQAGLETLDPLNAGVMIGLAQITLAQSGDVRQALESFSAAETRYPDTDTYLPALIGRADCEARLGAHGEAVAHLTTAAQKLVEQRHPDPGARTTLVDVVRSHYEMCFGRGEYEMALGYLSVLKPVFGTALPAAVLADFALTHERLGMQRRQEADQLVRKSPTQENEAARRLANQQAADQFAQAADYFLRHADAVTISDDEAHGNSLWNAAANFDRAQMWSRSIDVYKQFCQGRPSDSRAQSAMHQLGLAYMAEGEYAPASELFRRLVEEHPKSAATYRSLVPLARCHVALGGPDHALRVLEHVVKDHPAITPDAPEYRDALVELGKLHLAQGRYVEAIQTLEQAIDERRYGETLEGPTLRYRLADAYRREAREIEKTMAQSMPQTQRVALMQQRITNLERSQNLCSEVINAFEARSTDALTPVERVFYRNAYFYRADAAYDLGRFDQAVLLYDLAAKRWENDPASLVALVQIVNAYCEQGRMQEARVANDRARYQLRRIPDAAFDDPTLPMDRRHWEDWLRWTSELNLLASSSTTAGGP